VPTPDTGPPLPTDPTTFPDIPELLEAYKDADNETYARAERWWLNHHENGLPMFRQAKELVNMRSLERPPTDLGFVDRKLRQSKSQSSLGDGKAPVEGELTTYESIKKHGVQNPVSVTVAPPPFNFPRSEALNHGHHRVYSANEIDPGMEIPVSYRRKDDPPSPEAWVEPTAPRRGRWADHPVA
jgi:hypothetical protein